ncbi:MAG: ATP-binding cassette domain-containing protein [Bdellovibrionales bacterium]|nr:ATP-binding cassette domain-containing protein [Bdellovibrionales bacterium]
MSQNPQNLLQVRDLKVHFPMPKKFGQERAVVKAVDGIDLDIRAGETLGLVGESGCGKSTLGRAILQLIRPTEGSVTFEGQELTTLWKQRFGLFGVWSPNEMMRRKRQDMQMIFQDPFSSLNPRMTVEDIVGEPLKNYGILSGKALREKVQDLLQTVGMDPRYIRRYPHEFSGGQCQRIGIARALALNPKIIVADEPISALDVSIQAQILNLLEKLQDEFNLTYIFIAHDLAAVRHISDRVAVMYLGKVVEISDQETIIKNPKHPYTKALISAIPLPDPEQEKNRKHIVLEGDVPSPINPPSGCSFHTRCPIAEDRCKRELPILRNLNENHRVSCHLV